MSSPDAVVVGAGPNGLVAANLLVDAGWDVVVLEAQPEPGGAVHSDRSVHPAYVHDTFSSFYPLAAASPVIRGFDLESYGLVWEHAPAVVGTPYAEGGWAMLHRDRERTADEMERQHAGDGRAWLRWCEQWDAVGDGMIRALLSPFPPVRAGLSLAGPFARNGGRQLVRRLVAPAWDLAESTFGGRAPGLLLAGNAGHADIPMSAPGSGLMGWLLVMLGQQLGFPVPRGGAGALSQALTDRLRAHGGVLRTSTPVESVVVRQGRAVGVRTSTDETVPARRAVLADVSAPALYGGLVGWDDLPTSLWRSMRGFEWDPATVKVDWALDAPVPWTDPPPQTPGTVHLLDSVAEVERSRVEIRAGHLPRRPYLVMGQMAAADASRAPTGGESLWAYTHVPRGRSWGARAGEHLADRIEERIAEHAPDLARHVRARRVLTPPDLEARDANLVDGAINGGTSSLHQQLVLRPVPGLGRAETPVAGLYLASAAAHPGGGVHGACGSNAARAALAHARLTHPGPSRWRSP
ncbi:phytoene desaturase family protein [Luteipulveratus halotolerans]|uniref:Pyridine nucleotide-disulfide oxidoreductase domain-containing protein 2 n=1 Tax=Luteipulveratus halotolerans TaxID=1631356 RepID=A0A0L6CP94_9MICO|nr:NAD(P)/FAD-dependent oxidoreductase [Luteipulveratus halotolerans]KNX39591.1 FAD-dependent oxidoreductase [Luteipulveratus halotolerans]